MSIEPLHILDTEILPGKTVLKLDIARLHTRNKVKVPVIIHRGKKAGPTLLLLAGIHGDEVNGVEIVRQIIKNKYNRPKAGTVICLPVMNVFGFIHQTREFPDGRDLNRVFPGNSKGSLASRFAHRIMTEIVPHVDYIIDFHTGGANRFNYPHLRVNQDNEQALDLGKIFGAKFILNAPHRDRSFRQSAVEMGKIVLLYEGGKALHLDNDVTEIGINGTMRVMDHLGMRDFSKELKEYPKVKEQYLLQSSKWVRARHSGMYRKKLKLGSPITKGDVIGSISDPFGDFEKNVKASRTGFIFCSNLSPLVNQGDALIHIGFDELKL